MRALLLLMLASQIALAAPPADKYLVLDPRLIESATDAKLVQGTVEKSPKNPLFKADKLWENALNNLYPNLIYDAADQRFKLWYKCVLNDKDIIAKMMPPFTVHEQGWFLLYATSPDGVNWEKPNIGQFGFDGSKDNNAVARDTANVGVFKDDHDPDASRRYKLVFDQGMGKIQVKFSPDGIKWGDAIPTTGMPNTGDTHNNAFWDPRQKKYVLITKQYRGERLVYRSASDDFVNWSEPTLALRSTPEEGKKRQTYAMPSFIYGGGYVGFVMMYNATTDRTVDCELAYSTDTVTWTRPFAGQPLIPRGEKGAYDSGCIYAQANGPVEREGKLMIFYGGSEAVHKGWKRHCLPCLATMRVDGFAAYQPADEAKPGTIVTRPLTVTSGVISVSADASKGSLVASLLDKDGEEIDQSKPIRTDAVDAPLEWNRRKDLVDLKGQVVRLKFRLACAKLFALGGVEAGK